MTSFDLTHKIGCVDSPSWQNKPSVSEDDSQIQKINSNILKQSKRENVNKLSYLSFRNWKICYWVIDLVWFKLRSWWWQLRLPWNSAGVCRIRKQMWGKGNFDMKPQFPTFVHKQFTDQISCYTFKSLVDYWRRK